MAHPKRRQGKTRTAKRRTHDKEKLLCKFIKTIDLVNGRNSPKNPIFRAFFNL